MLGVLVKGDLDDGRGSARVNLFRHKHEVETGRTSSVGMEILGFDASGSIVASDTPGRKLSWEEVGKRSAKVITFSDLAGHERYLRTTVFGMLSGSPDYCLLMVAANNGLIGMSKEHLGIAVALNVPVIVVVTKIDICPPQILQETLSQLTKILKSPGARKIPVFIKDREECINTATQMVSPRICPVFQVSNVTGDNLDLVRTFLNVLPQHGYYNADAPFEFTVNDTFSVPFVGTVVAGIIQSGVIHAGDTVLVGPDSLGQFATTSVRSIERKRIPVQGAEAGQSASLALKRMRRKDVRKGMVVMPKVEGQAPPKVYREFVAEGVFPFTYPLFPHCEKKGKANIKGSPRPLPRNDHQDALPGDAPRGLHLADLRHCGGGQALHTHGRQGDGGVPLRAEARVRAGGGADTDPRGEDEGAGDHQGGGV